jgi:hypothetical protein
MYNNPVWEKKYIENWDDNTIFIKGLVWYAYTGTCSAIARMTHLNLMLFSVFFTPGNNALMFWDHWSYMLKLCISLSSCRPISTVTHHITDSLKVPISFSYGRTPGPKGEVCLNGPDELELKWQLVGIWEVCPKLRLHFVVLLRCTFCLELVKILQKQNLYVSEKKW